jgi:hypothetical protein
MRRQEYRLAFGPQGDRIALAGSGLLVGQRLDGAGTISPEF